MPSSIAISDLKSLVDPRERTRYALMLTFSLLVYAAIGYIIYLEPATAVTFVLYVGLGALIMLMVQGMALGSVRGNGIRVSRTQLPMLHQMVMNHAKKLRMSDVPAVYVVQAGGHLNAFATRFFGRDFVVIYSDVLAMAMRQGDHAVSFIVAHELGHVWRGHLRNRWLIAPARFVPYLGAAYSRGCEYTCDRIGAYCEPGGAIPGIVALAAGVDVFPHVHVPEFAAQTTEDAGFWVRRAELMSTHPRLPKRVVALMELGVQAPVPQAMPVREAQVA